MDSYELPGCEVANEREKSSEEIHRLAVWRAVRRQRDGTPINVKEKWALYFKGKPECPLMGSSRNCNITSPTFPTASEKIQFARPEITISSWSFSPEKNGQVLHEFSRLRRSWLWVADHSTPENSPKNQTNVTYEEPEEGTKITSANSLFNAMNELDCE